MPRGASAIKRWLQRGAKAFLAVALLILFAFSLLQSPVGRAWLVAVIDRSMSSPGSSVTIVRLEGTIPFDMRAERIEVADDHGAWLTVDRPQLELSATSLLAGNLHIEALSAAAIDVARPPNMPANPAAPTPLSERLRLPHLPAGIAVDRITVGRVTLESAVLGEPVEANLTGNAALAAGSARVTLDLHRTDGQPGSLNLEAVLAGASPALSLQLRADEPTGVLLGRVLQRDDRPPLALSFAGEGPLSQWRGRLEASAGSLARLRFDVTLASGPDTIATIDGIASLAPLLQPATASVVGDNVPIHVHATFAQNGVLTLDEMSVRLAAGSIIGGGSFGGPDRRLTARVQADLPNLGLLAGRVGDSLAGYARLTAALSGTELRPALVIDVSGDTLRFGAAGARHADIHLTVGSTTDLDQPEATIAIATEGRVQGVIVPNDLALPSELGRDLDWSFTAQTSPDGDMVKLTDLSVRGIGLDVGGSGRLGPGLQVHDGRLHLAIADLRPLAPVLGLPVAGALKLDATETEPPGAAASIEFSGSATGLHSVPAIDALTEGSFAILGTIGQKNSGTTWALDRLALFTAKASLKGNGELDLATSQLNATMSAEIPSLLPLGVAGHAAGRLTIEGALDHPKMTAQLDTGDVRIGSAKLDQFRLDASLSDLWAAQAKVDGQFRSGDLSGTLTFDVDARNLAELVISRFRVQAADGSAEGSFRIDRRTLLTRGALSARIPNLSRWSAFAGQPLGGSVELKVNLERGSGQNLNLSATGDRLSFGPVSTHLELGHLGVTWDLTDAMGAPAGKAQAKLTALALGSGRFDEASLSFASTRPGHFAFTADAKGRFVDPVAFTSRGEFETAPHAGMDLRIVSFAGSIGNDRVQLTAPLTISHHGDDVALSSLALMLGSGQISGNAALRGRTLSGHLAAKNLPIAPGARFAGYKSAAGTVTLDANFGGTPAAPTGRFTLSGRGLTLAHAEQHVPAIGLDTTGDWNGRELGIKGKVGGPKGESLTFTGSVPLLLTAAPLSLTMPPSGRLALKLEGTGDLGNVSDLLPIGEDRVSGHFSLDAGLNGTLANPAASGHLSITDGRYESFATGAVLTNLRVDLVGDRDRFTLRTLTAADSAKGTLTAHGSVALSGTPGPLIEFGAKLSGFRVAARDEAVVTVTGGLDIAGGIMAPKITGKLTVDRADCIIPDSLPPSVTRLKVVEINHSTIPGARRPAPQTQAAAFAAPLDIEVMLPPGQTFVRGHGLDSEWRGRLKISGTSSAPAIAGSLESVRGTFDILGKTFRVSRGAIVFDGAATFDPRLDITAEVAAADITAQAIVGGAASAPTVTLSSTPAVPQDEILSRVLFGRGLGQISTGEGLQVAQAAATLAGGGPGVLDKLRTGLGLDRLSFGAAADSTAGSNLNPAAGGSATGSPAVSGGKYVTKGVYVGVTQGTTPSTNKISVEVDVYPHVTVETDRSQSGGTGLGLNYKYDY
jgi:translocation and assembly module TamB